MVRMIFSSVGKRKKAIARATLKDGSGIVRINKKIINSFPDKYIRLRVQEPLLLTKDLLPLEKINIDVEVKGGGAWGQADAARTAIGKLLMQYGTKTKKALGENIKNMFTDYDRSIVVSDARRTETHKPSRSSAGPRRKKQQSKR